MLKGLKKHPYLSALLLLALGARIYFEVAYIDFNMDKARQLFIAQCFLEGDGFSFCTADLTDLSRITCHRIKYWAIGYPFFISAIHILFNGFTHSSIILASIILDMAGLLVLFSGFHIILKTSGAGGKAYAMFMIFTAFTFTPYYYTGSTDFLSAALYLLALAMTLEFMGDRKFNKVRFVFIGSLVFLAAFLRYAYYPFLFILPVFLAAMGM